MEIGKTCCCVIIIIIAIDFIEYLWDKVNIKIKKIVFSEPIIEQGKHIYFKSRYKA